MKVAVDTSGLKIHRAGAYTYTVELLRALRALDADCSIEEISYDPVFSRKRRICRIYDTLIREIIWTGWGIPQRSLKTGCDLIHVPGIYVPKKSPLPMIATVLDLHVYLYPEHFQPWHRKSASYFLKQAVRSADYFITISHHVKKDLIESFPEVDPDQVYPIHLGVSPQFRPASEEKKEQIRKKYKLHRPFILSVSTIAPSKNCGRLLEAYRALADQIDHDLVFVGISIDGWTDVSLESKASELRLKGRIRYLGYVPDEDLPTLYSCADVLAFPSLYEGFGLPALEGMACGTAVLTSNTTSLPEVVGAAALTIDPYSVEEISTGLLSLVKNTSLCCEMGKAGRIQAADFTWEKCARETLAVYHEAINTT